jgi:hypothetical protein
MKPIGHIGQDLTIQVVIVVIGVRVKADTIVGIGLEVDIDLMIEEGMTKRADLEAEVILGIFGTRLLQTQIDNGNQNSLKILQKKKDDLTILQSQKSLRNFQTIQQR